MSDIPESKTEELFKTINEQLTYFQGKSIEDDNWGRQNEDYTIESLARVLLGKGYDPGEKYREKDLDVFYAPFIAKVIEKYAGAEQDAELLLAINGLLDGYRELGITDRCKTYAKEAANFDKQAKPYWKDAPKSLKKRIEKVNRKMALRLAQEIIDYKSKKLYRIANEVLQEITGDDGVLRFSPRRPKYLTAEDSPIVIKKSQPHLRAIPDDVYERETSIFPYHMLEKEYGNGESRPGYSAAEVSGGILGDNIMFNSIYDGKSNDSYNYNEKDFLSIRKAYRDEDAWEYRDVHLENNTEYLVRIYIRNNNPSAEAEDVRVSIDLQSRNFLGNHMIKGCIWVGNSCQNLYWSGINLTGTQDFNLEYLPGSARICNGGIGAGKDGYPLPDTIITDRAENGVLIGYDRLDGRIPGGLLYNTYVYARLKAVYYVDFDAASRARIAGTALWGKDINAAIGDLVEIQVAYRNISKSRNLQHDVTILDGYTENLEYIADSAKIWTCDGYGIIMEGDSALFAGGYNIGDYSYGANALMRFTVRITDDSLALGENEIRYAPMVEVEHMGLTDTGVIRIKKSK